MQRVSTIAVVVGLMVGTAEGQTPFIENHIVARPAGWMTTQDVFTDIPASQKTIMIPPGQAVMTWCLNGVVNAGVADVRPAIGDAIPDASIYATLDPASQVCGSWTTETSGGTVDVGLQILSHSGPQTVGDVASMSWTLIVFPDSTVPAVGNVALGIMALGLIAVAGYVMRRRVVA